MGDCLSSPHTGSNPYTIASLHPREWSQQQIIAWLHQTGNLSDLIKPFKKHKIAGLTFAHLTCDELKNELNITQFGLVKEFILLRDKLLSHYNKDLETHSYSHTPHTDTPSSTLHNKEMPTYLLNQIQSNNNTNNTHNNDDKPRETSPLLSETHSTNIAVVKDDDCCLDNLVPPTSNVDADGRDSISRNRLLCADRHGWKVKNKEDNAMVTVNDLKWEQIENKNCSTCVNTKNIYDYTFMQQYRDISYVGGSKLVINGCIRALSLLIGCNNVNNEKICELTYKYYFEREKHAFQFGYDVWKILYKIDFMFSVNGEEYKAFLGNCLVSETRKKYWNKYRFGNNMSYCNDLLSYGYIQLIAKKQGLETAEDNNNIHNEYINDNKYLYQFIKVKKRQFKKYHNFIINGVDRNSWCRGTSVEIFSESLNGWQIGEIINIDVDDNIVVSYINEHNESESEIDSKYLLKTVGRNELNLVRSTREYVLNRNKWEIGMGIEIFSNSEMRWCAAMIESIRAKDTNNNVCIDSFRVKYKKYSDGLYYTKIVNHWSCNCRDVQIINDKQLLTYKYQKQCQIWSQDKQKWIVNNIKDIIPRHKYVVVENPKNKMETIIDINSGFIRLLNE